MNFLIIAASIFLSSSAFSDQSTCTEGETWIAPHHRKAHFRSKSYIPATDVVGHCRTKGKAYDFWAALISNESARGWPNKNERHKEWTGKELRDLIKALSDIPEWLWAPITFNRYAKSDSKANPASSVPGTIVLYDEAFTGAEGLARVVAHELAHQKYPQLSPIERVTHRQVSGWRANRRTDGKVEFKNTGRKSKHDSDLSPEEDFANGVELYLYEPTRLKFRNEPVYNWLEIEYGDKLKVKK